MNGFQRSHGRAFSVEIDVRQWSLLPMIQTLTFEMQQSPLRFQFTFFLVVYSLQITSIFQRNTSLASTHQGKIKRKGDVEKVGRLDLHLMDMCGKAVVGVSSRVVVDDDLVYSASLIIVSRDERSRLLFRYANNALGLSSKVLQ